MIGGIQMSIERLTAQRSSNIPHRNRFISTRTSKGIRKRLEHNMIYRVHMSS